MIRSSSPIMVGGLQGVRAGVASDAMDSIRILFSNPAPKQIAQGVYTRADGLGVQVERVEQDGAHPDGARGQSVVRVGVADEGRLPGLDPEPFERVAEDGRVGFSEADEVRVDYHVEAFGQPRRLQRIAHPPVLSVRDDGDEESLTPYLID